MKAGAKDKKYLVNRETYKSIKKYDHAQMENFLTRVYVEGFKDGTEADKGIDTQEATAKEQELMYQAIETGLDATKGVGEKLKQRILENIRGLREMAANE